MFEEPPAIDLVSAIQLAGQAVDARVLAGLRRAGLTGLTVGHGYVVQRLIDGPSTVGEVAAALGVTQQAVSKTVRELTRLGYVEQAVDEADRRRHPVSLTARGRRAVAVAREARAALAASLEAAAGPERLAAAAEVLAAALDELGVAERIRRRAAPPPPERS